MHEQLVNPEIHARLARLRAALRRRLTGEALAWMTMAAVAVVFVTLGADFVLRLDRVQRGIVMALSYAVLGYVAWRALVAPLRVRMTGDDLALLVERRHSLLGDRLISALQFERRSESHAVAESPAMIRAAIAQANELAAGVEFGDVVERRNMWRVVRIAACAAALLAGFALWQGPVMRLWAQRHLLLMSDTDAPWPQKTYLEIVGAENGVFHVLRGDDLKVAVLVQGQEAPPNILLHVRYPSLAGMTEETLEPADSSGRLYAKVFPSVAEPFEFYVTGGDDKRGRRSPTKVELIEAPALGELKFTVIAPAYMNRTPYRADASRGTLSAPVGSTIQYTAVPTKDLARALVLIDGEVVGTAAIVEAPAADGGGDRPARAGVGGSFVVAGSNAPASRSLCFRIEDTQGYVNRRAAVCSLQVQADLSPNVEARKFGVSQRVSPRAIIPLTIDLRDDHGLWSAQALVKCPARNAQPPGVAVEGIEPGMREFSARRHEVNLEPMAFQPGDVLALTVEAADSMPRELGGPNVGRSAVIDLRVVKPEELREELIARQKALREEFVQTIALQESSRAKTASAGEAAAGDRLPPEIDQMLLDSSRMQATVAAQTAHVADAMIAIRDELSNNRLAGPDERAQLATVIDPLEAMGKPMTQAAALLTGARQIQDPPEAQKQILEIAAVQAAILAQMQDVLQRMQKLESRQELANQLEILIKWSEGLRDSIEKIGQRETGGLFLPTQPASRPGGP